MSWSSAFTFREEVRDGQGQIIKCGLRPPQVGALFAALAHWRGAADPATIVMPTGTGKTETMLAILAHEWMPRLLVVVPSNALRNQIVEKFETFGLLKPLGVLGPQARFPVVCTLRHMPRSAEEAERIFTRCNVVVASMQVLRKRPVTRRPSVRLPR
ncbi:DEAD/DEAH box helicase family protein, partial [Roseomonas sp. NAR14]|nr:DEAD/DEAH box helicase family protein [Roseomonas acroporae]